MRACEGLGVSVPLSPPVSPLFPLTNLASAARSIAPTAAVPLRNSLFTLSICPGLLARSDVADFRAWHLTGPCTYIGTSSGVSGSFTGDHSSADSMCSSFDPEFC